MLSRRHGWIAAAAQIRAIYDVNRCVNPFGKAAHGRVQIAAATGARRFDNPREIRAWAVGIAECVLLHRDSERDRGAVRAEDGLTLPPEVSTAAAPLREPSMRDADEFAPALEGLSMFRKDGEGALNKGDRHTNLNFGPLRGGRCRSLTDLTPAPGSLRRADWRPEAA